MIHVTAGNFEIETRQTERPVVVMFYAKWCGKCAMMKPVAEDLEKKYKRKIRFCEVDTDESPALASRFGAEIVPTFILMKQGEAEGILQGVIGEGTLEKALEELLS